jgi:molybdopterin molybdotransferase
VGDHDLVQTVLSEVGLVVDFWQIAMRPGKPLMAGRLGAVPMVGLPGNPVSSLVCAILFLLPVIHRLCGLPAAAPPTMQARLAAPLAANDHRADHLRATLATDADGGLQATAFPRQDSAMLRLMAQAQALILRPPHAPALPAGAVVDIINLDFLGL